MYFCSLTVPAKATPGRGMGLYPPPSPQRQRAGSLRRAEPETTNNRMELTAVIRGLERPSNALPWWNWLPTASTWARALPSGCRDGKPMAGHRKEGKSWAAIKNEDLWRRLDELLSRHQVIFRHIAGHTSHPENERCLTPWRWLRTSGF